MARTRPNAQVKDVKKTPDPGPWRRAWRQLKHHRPGMIGLGVVALFIILAALAPLLAPADPYVQNMDLKFLPPYWQDGGTWPHLLGTDILGRDVLARLLYGARLSLLIGFISVMVGASIGIPLGMVSGYVGGALDILVMRLIDVMLAFPSILLAVSIVAILGPSLENAMVAIGVVAIPTYARVVRASVLAEREREYVTADIAMGRRSHHILFKAILPNVFSPLLVIMTLSFASAVLEAAGLSFIGLGAQPPTPEWGALLFEGKTYVYNAPWLIMFPGLAILFTVIGFNLFGDALRDVFDPKSVRR
jgi:ABC-type dipeptide/oligopeptide/nickel transport system permease subunit